MPSKSIRGFNANEKTVSILKEQEIPKMGFSKFMNTVVEEWHLSKTEKINVKVTRQEGKITGVILD